MALTPLSDNVDSPAIEQISTERKVLRYLLNIIILFVFGCLCVHVISWIVMLWPQYGTQVNDVKLFLFVYPYEFTLNLEQRYLVMVAMGGVLGAFVHIATSFVDFLGSRKLSYSWIPWYLMRPFIGGALALIFYLLLRGGLISPAPPTQGGAPPNGTNTTLTAASAKEDPLNPEDAPLASADSDTLKKLAENTDPIAASQNEDKPDSPDNSVPINPYGIMALACMAGMFSKQATDKLREVFDSLFRMKAGNETDRADPLLEKGNSNPTEVTASNGPVPKNDDAAAG